jgi:hypothetical protein
MDRDFNSKKYHFCMLIVEDNLLNLHGPPFCKLFR